MIEVLRLTGFKTYGEFLRETDAFERRLLTESIRSWHRERSDAGGGL